jgi:predicted component of type VI protein secretion system
MGFRLRYLAHDLELPVGEFVIGRSAECQLSLDDPLVSRRHAVLRVRKDGVAAADLGSRNGVLVNGVRIEGVRELVEGDKVTIGSQELTLLKADDRPRVRSEDDFRRATQTLGAVNVDLRSIQEPTVAEEPSTRVSSFRLLGGVADKALAMGRAEEAERILQALLVEVRQRARDGKLPDPEVAEQAARYAARLAGATMKGSWVDYVFELYGATKRPLPAPVVDELYTVVRKVKSLDLGKIRAYVAELREMSASFGPTDRFLVQRIEGLERLGSLK